MNRNYPNFSCCKNLLVNIWLSSFLFLMYRLCRSVISFYSFRICRSIVFMFFMFCGPCCPKVHSFIDEKNEKKTKVYEREKL